MAGKTKYNKLLEPYRIGAVKTRNRIYKTAASMMSCHEDEVHMNPVTLAYYEALARGGAGLISVEAPTVDYPLGVRWRERYRMDDDKYIDGMSELVAVIHKYECPAFMQIEHDGPWQSPLFDNAPPLFDGPPIGASPMQIDSPGDFHRDLIRELSIGEIQEIIKKCAQAALRARKAGFDGIDINAGSTHLFHNFLSPFWNRRQDEYGGTIEKRARFLIEIIKDIKVLCGHDFPVVICLNGIEMGRTIGVDDSTCLTWDIARENARLVQEAGADAIMVRNTWLGYHVGGFLPDYLFYPEPPVPLHTFPKIYNWHGMGAGANIFMAEALKKALSIPIIAVGKINPELGEEYLEEGRADLIGMHRALMCDPELPNKLATGKRDQIAPCTACGTCLDQSTTFLRHCRINASIGTAQYTVEKAEKRKEVVIIGGGPAGMEAARVAALRGHGISLYERSNKPGGLLSVASVVKGVELENLPDMIRYFKAQLAVLGVKIHQGKEIDSSTIESLKPDVVIVASGGKVVDPEIKGIESRIVLTSSMLHQMLKPWLKLFSPRMIGWLTKLWLPVGRKVIVIGSGLHGMELAEFLIKRGREVTIVDTAEVPGEGMLDFRMGLIMDWFDGKGVTLINGVKDIEITGKGLNFITKNGEQMALAADTIIPARPLAADTTLLDELQGKVPELYAIGDCIDPKMIVNAIAAGWNTASNI